MDDKIQSFYIGYFDGVNGTDWYSAIQGVFARAKCCLLNYSIMKE